MSTTQSSTQTGDTPEAREHRERLIDALMAGGDITCPVVEAAMRRVPRHLFTPEVGLEQAYARDVVRTKYDADGRVTSSVSAPHIQAMMLQQAGIEPGMRVLEIGSGGYNAALLAELVGPNGQVTTVDIDPDIVDRARTCLIAAGYQQVHVAHGDGEYGLAERAPYDRIIVTVGAWDIPPAWTEQLAPGGTITLPLLMRGITRSLTLTSNDGHLRAGSALMCGFVQMQGAGAHPRQEIALRDGEVNLYLDDVSPLDPATLDTVFDTDRVEAWTGVTVASNESFESLLLWLATSDDGGAMVSIDPERDTCLLDPWTRQVEVSALMRNGTLAYLALRETGEGRHEFGAHAYGRDTTAFAAHMAELIRRWDREHRGGPSPSITIYPRESGHAVTSGVVLMKRHTRVHITWP